MHRPQFARPGALVVAALIATAAHGQVYKCQVDGRTVFSDRPCSSDARKVDIRPASGHTPAGVPGGTGTDPVAAPINSSTNPRALLDRIERDRRIRALEHEIDARRSRIGDEQVAMDRDLAALRQQKARANNNLAGATWEKSISEEMGVVVARYDVRIRTLRDEIDRLEKDLSDLKR